jgi:hypothetical protein
MHSSELHHIEALLDPSKTEIDAVQADRGSLRIDA